MIIKQVKQCTLKKVVTLKTLWSGLIEFINQMKRVWLIVAVFVRLVYVLLKKITPNVFGLCVVALSRNLKLTTTLDRAITQNPCYVPLNLEI